MDRWTAGHSPVCSFRPWSWWSGSSSAPWLRSFLPLTPQQYHKNKTASSHSLLAHCATLSSGIHSFVFRIHTLTKEDHNLQERQSKRKRISERKEVGEHEVDTQQCVPGTSKSVFMSESKTATFSPLPRCLFNNGGYKCSLTFGKKLTKNLLQLQHNFATICNFLANF